MDYQIFLSGTPYSLSTSDDAQIAAIAACRVKFNEALPQEVEDAPNPALLATDAAYLEYVFGHWAAANPGFTEADLHAAFASAAASYAGQNPPEQIVEEVELTGDALKAALRAYAADKRWRLEIGGITVNGLSVPTDDRAKLLLFGAAMCMADGSSSKLVIAGVDYGTFTKAQFVALNAAVIAHVQGLIGKLADVIAEINAEINAETITTTAEIDAYAWL